MGDLETSGFWMSGKAVLDHFSVLADPWQSWKVVYPLPEILAVILCATLAGVPRISWRSNAGLGASFLLR